MASRKFTKPISNEPSSSGWPGSGMSYTLANALASRRNSNDRQIEYTGPVSSANTAVYSKFVPEEASLSRFGGGLQVAQGIKRSRSEDEYHDERYYQRQLAHLQIALMREHSLLIRVTIAFSILVVGMLVAILYLLQRPASCDREKRREIKWNINIPILSPWTSTHENTNEPKWGWSVVLLIFSLSVLAWQNRNTVLKPMFRLVSGHAGEILRLLLR